MPRKPAKPAKRSPARVRMYCPECDKVTAFELDTDASESCNGKPDYACECGWLQSDPASGAAELCRLATWHDLDAYRKMAAIARQGGHDVPATPPKFAPADEHIELVDRVLLDTAASRRISEPEDS